MGHQISTPQTLLKAYFGYEGFRPLQGEIIDHILAGKDAIVLMPTGGGKSLCYQVPALALPGLTLVISPLISLMKDQVMALVANGIPAAYDNSTLDEGESQGIRDRVTAGEIKLLYLSPERALSFTTRQWLASMDLSLIAIDEAHCVSSWGHSFRPEYQRLIQLSKQFPRVPKMALTATADRTVRSELGELLGLDQPQTFLSSFDRPNLSLSVLPGKDKLVQIKRILKIHKGQSGIIYCSSRKSCESVAAKLDDAGYDATAYHAGMDGGYRSKVHESFLAGRIPIVVATVAFGMGIDKPDIRFVIHYNMPGNLESYYQEIGRAGRDGDPAHGYLFYSYRDVQTQLGFIEALENHSYAQVQEAKLLRMQEYAESAVCRRQVLLSYFSEEHGGNCGNCDVCADPPKFFDGTIEAQKLLSAVARSNEQLSMGGVIDLLRGHLTPDLEKMGLQRLKTFGVGTECTPAVWQLYAMQLIQQGLLELDYRDHFRLKLTERSKQVLFQGQKVQLISLQTVRDRQERLKEQPIADPAGSGERPYDKELYVKLKAVRKHLAAEIDKPAFFVCSDQSLKDMARIKPTSRRELLQVKGIGEHKADVYGPTFIAAIIK